MAVVTPRGDLCIAFHRGRSSTARRAAGRRRAWRTRSSTSSPTSSQLRGRHLPGPATADPDGARHADPPRAGGRRRRVRRSRARRARAKIQTSPPVWTSSRPPRPTRCGRRGRRGRVRRASPVRPRRAGRPRGALADEVLQRVGEHGTDLTGIDRVTVFRDVRRATVRSGEYWSSRGRPQISSTCRSVTDSGPALGGYPAAPMHPWVPVGTTGAVRRSGRNSRVVAERDVDVLAVPGRAYVLSWLVPSVPRTCGLSSGRARPRPARKKRGQEAQGLAPLNQAKVTGASRVGAKTAARPPTAVEGRARWEGTCRALAS